VQARLVKTVSVLQQLCQIGTNHSVSCTVKLDVSLHVHYDHNCNTCETWNLSSVDIWYSTRSVSIQYWEFVDVSHVTNETLRSKRVGHCENQETGIHSTYCLPEERPASIAVNWAHEGDKWSQEQNSEKT